MREYRYNIGEKIKNRYEVNQILHGGMGIVYICYDHVQKINFALKSFLDKYLISSEAKSRFQTEATIWVNLGYHTNIVQAERIERIDGKPFLILECILDKKGYTSDLATKIAEKGKVDVKTALKYSIQICLGLQYAQSKYLGIVHRDLKPNNILINDKNVAKVTDFGIAVVPEIAKGKTNNNNLNNSNRNKTITGKGEIIGTPSYMSPEQYRGESIDLRSDIYSLGCIIYEMLLGENYAYNKMLYPDFKELFKGIDTEILNILMKCLAEYPDNRYQNFLQLGNDLFQCYERMIGEKPEIFPMHQMMPGVWMQFSTQISTFEDAVNISNSFDNAVKKGSVPVPLITHQKGISLMEIGRYEEALECFDKFINDYYENINDEIEQKYIKITGKDEKSFLKEHDEGLSSVYVSKGNALQALNRGEESVNAYKKAISLNLENFNAWYNLGEVLFNQLKDIKGAIESYLKAIELNPDDDMAYSSLGFVYWENNERDKAIKSFDKALAINPRLVNALGNKGSILSEIGQFDDALQCFNRIIEIDPGNVLGWVHKGLIIQRYNLNKAYECFKRVHQIEPQNPYFKMLLENCKK